MASTNRAEGSLSQAALAFEQELARYEKICAELSRTKVRSEKTLSRTRRLLGESSECEQELGVRLSGFLDAMNGARDRQQACMGQALAAAQELQARAARFSELMALMVGLGERTREIGQPAAEVMAGASQGATTEVLVPLEQVAERMALVLREADNIAQAADQDDWPEIARDVKGLRQQVQAAYDKVLRARSNVDR